MDKIDFVVTWVDGDDPAWLAERAKYLPGEDASASASNRYRDWGLMKYWFRGVEKFAPWVNNIYFVTWGHYPEWLNLEHPKLKVIKHTDYIPAEYLPTFNSNVIELNLHRIPELSEQFVLFNDDTFLTDYVKTTDFFQTGLPCETARLGEVYTTNIKQVFPYTILNSTAIINKYFSKRDVTKRYWKKFYALKYGTDLIRNLLLSPFKYFSAFYDTHLPASHLKSTFFEVWEKEAAVLEACGSHRFRSRDDVMHWLMKWWRFCQGQFIPRSSKWGKCFEIGKDSDIKQAIMGKRYKAICVNDSSIDFDFEKEKRELLDAFRTILPKKSQYEK